ncbi:hypothetical protein DFJ74DRAFT_454611 [Hyaloraphidium curvatum]|nr:hypothetical protein DFJ74DRAFT_454611 [Hyaloraphidium curvatum]
MPSTAASAAFLAVILGLALALPAAAEARSLGVWSYKDGGRYAGETDALRKRHGHGVLVWKDGSTYEGQFRENRFFGCGVYRTRGRFFFGLLPHEIVREGHFDGKTTDLNGYGSVSRTSWPVPWTRTKLGAWRPADNLVGTAKEDKAGARNAVSCARQAAQVARERALEAARTPPAKLERDAEEMRKRGEL